MRCALARHREWLLSNFRAKKDRRKQKSEKKSQRRQDVNRAINNEQNFNTRREKRGLRERHYGKKNCVSIHGSSEHRTSGREAVRPWSARSKGSFWERMETVQLQVDSK